MQNDKTHVQGVVHFFAYITWTGLQSSHLKLDKQLREHNE